MNAILGLALAALAGAMNGSFSLPMKWTRKWAWENTWLAWAFTGLLVIPWAIASFTVPSLMSVYAHARVGSLAMMVLFGVAWGIGALAFGQGLSIVGISLGFAISIGLTTAIGSIVPMATDPSIFLTARGAIATIGVIVTVIGVIVCAVAGGRKESQIAKAHAEEDRLGTAVTPRASFAKGLVLAVVAGLFLPLLNFALNFSADVKTAAAALGASDGGCSDAIWAFTLLGAFAANLLYCSVLLTKNRTWSGYASQQTGVNWALGLAMGLLWMLSMTCYGRAAKMMGPLGSSAGWAIFMGCVIVTSNLWGLITGEWREGKGKPLATMYTGLAVVLVAISVIGYASSLSG